MGAYVWFVRGEEHAKMALTSIASVQHNAPDPELLVMTDDETASAWAGLIATTGAEVVTFESRKAPIMVANLEAQVQALFIAESDTITFLDTDTILRAELPTLGELTVTWRDHAGAAEDGEITPDSKAFAEMMPYNYGVIGARNNKAVAEAFIWMRERVRRMHPQHQGWYGNQFALAELCGQRPKDGSVAKIDTRYVQWKVHEPTTPISVGKIPCDIYNHTPQEADECVDGKFVLHFKGKRRGLMQGYAIRHAFPWYA